MIKTELASELLHQIKLLAPHSFPVHIFGTNNVETMGIAKYLHHLGPYTTGPFTTLQCRELPEADLSLEFDIFSSKRIRTIYIKDVDSLSLDYQDALLKRLNESSKKNYRLISSSTCSLFEQIKKGLFNKFLFVRLNAAPIELPKKQNQLAAILGNIFPLYQWPQNYYNLDLETKNAEL